MDLLDYRHLDESEPYDKIASVGMFEHVGRARLPEYFAKIRRLLKPGGLLLNHGITAGGTRNHQLGAGLGDFIDSYIFPGGELEHVSHVLEHTADAGLEAVDVESLRPHYAKTLWAWSDALEAQLGTARTLTTDTVLRAYRLYLAGSAMCFERAWLSLHQMLCARRDGRRRVGADARRTIGVPLQPRVHVSAALSRATDVPIQVEGRRRPDHDGAGRRPAPAHHRPRAGAARESSRWRRCRRRSPRSSRRLPRPSWRASTHARRTTTMKRGGANAIGLQQRAWPLLEMMRRSLAERADIVWGV